MDSIGHKRLAAFVLSFLALVILFYAYYPLAASGPAESHSLLLLEHGAKTPWWRFWDIPVAEGPRFVMYSSFAIQHLFSGLRSFDYYVVNIVLLWLSGIFVGLFCYRVTFSLGAAVLSASIYFVFDSLYNTIEWLPARQEPMVIIFGVGALLYVMRTETTANWKAAAFLFIMLCLSVFSKEYGLVFVAGTAWYTLVWRRDLLLKVWGVCAAVTLLLLFARFATAVGVYQHVLQCEDMGFMKELARACTTTDLSDLSNVAQLAWNFGIGLLAQIIPTSPGQGNYFITPYTIHGAIQLERMEIEDWLMSAGCVALFAVAIIKRMPFLTLCLIMILANAFLSAPFFRSRNVLFGFVATTVILSYGTMAVADYVARISWGRISPEFIKLRGPAPRGASVILWLAAITYFAVAVIPQVGVLHAQSLYEQRRKSTSEYICPQAATVVNRDLGGGKTVRADIIERILEENRIPYRNCDIFLE
jgi:hypothetical protein